MTLTVVSLFAGVGGFDVAFARAGAKVVAAVEIDKPARSVLAKRFPETVLFDDVTKVTGDELRATGFVPERGILTGGFPCQDLSVAGRRDGLAGTRSGLFWHIVRLLAELHPAWFVLENVPGLLSSKCEPECAGGCFETHGGAMGTVLGALGELGYGVAYRVLDAKYFGVPQQRRRVFIVGHLGTPYGAAAEVLFESESSVGDLTESSTEGTRVTGLAAVGADSSGEQLLDHTHTHNDFARWRPTRLPGRSGGGSRWTTHRREVVSALTAKTGGPDDNDGQAGHLIECVTGGVTHTLTSEGADASEDGTGRGTPIIAATLTARYGKGPSTDAPDASIIVQSNFDPNDRVVAPLLSAHRGVPSTDEANQLVVAVHENQRGEITTRDTAGLTLGGGKPGQGYPAVAIDMRNAARSSGNGAGTQGDGIREDGISYSLPATQMALPAISHDTIVRRLTPLECERLQGFPDGWTEGQSDAQRYRQMGNAVAVPVVEWIARRLIAVDGEVA